MHESDHGPVCVTELFDSTAAPPCSDFSLGISRHWNTRGNLLGPTSLARGGLRCWPLAAGWPCCRPRTPYPAALPESSAVALFLR